jgi:hypothetical protein
MTGDTGKGATATPVAAGEKKGGTTTGGGQAHSCAPCFAAAAALSALVHFDFLKDETGEITRDSLYNVLLRGRGTAEQRQLASKIYADMPTYGHEAGKHVSRTSFAAGSAAMEVTFESTAYAISKADLVKLSGMPASITDKLTK